MFNPEKFAQFSAELNFAQDVAHMAVKKVFANRYCLDKIEIDDGAIVICCSDNNGYTDAISVPPEVFYEGKTVEACVDSVTGYWISENVTQENKRKSEAEQRERQRDQFEFARLKTKLGL